MPELNREIFLKGKIVHLRALTVNDIEGNYRYWLNDEEVVHFNSHGRFPLTQDKLKDYVQSVYRSDNNLVLAVIDNKSCKHIGNISLQKIQWIDRDAEIAFLLGEKDFHGKGIMFEAGNILINHGFNALNLHRIYCGTSSENIGMQKLAVKLGMTQEGVRKEAFFKNGKYLDLVEYGILRTQVGSK